MLPAPRLELVDHAAAMRTQMTGRALCERRVAVALLGDVELTEEHVEALQRDCGAPPPQ